MSLTKTETELLFPKIKQYFSESKKNFNFEMLENLKQFIENNKAVEEMERLASVKD